MAFVTFHASELEWEPRDDDVIYGAPPVSEGADFFDDVP
jgi:hypothetical protein